MQLEGLVAKGAQRAEKQTMNAAGGGGECFKSPTSVSVCCMLFACVSVWMVQKLLSQEADAIALT